MQNEQVRYRFMETYVFDTCTHKCAYCWLAESGQVLDASQLKPFRDPNFIRKLTSFFAKRTTDDEKWKIGLTGGEPLLMPNFALFVDELAEAGNKVHIYTALLVGDNNPAFRYLLDRDPGPIDYLMVSFHPEAEEREDAHFERLSRLKRNGHRVIFRLVGHPTRLDRLDELAAKCRERDIAFHPTTLFSPEYPSAYSAEERRKLENHFCSLSQVIQLENGLDTTDTYCTAASEMFAVNLRTGLIVPCVSVDGPVLGNIYEDRLDPVDKPIRCPKAGISCICDVHFQQAIVHGADDRAAFEAEKVGYVAPVDVASLKERLRTAGLRFSTVTPGIGQTETAQFRSLDAATVKAAFERNRVTIVAQHEASNHAEFGRRQYDSSTLGRSNPTDDQDATRANSVSASTT